MLSKLSPLSIQSCLTSKIGCRSESNHLSNADASSRPSGRDRDRVHVDVCLYLVLCSIETENSQERCRPVFERFKAKRVTALLCLLQASPLAVTCKTEMHAGNLPLKHGRYCHSWANQNSPSLPYLEPNHPDPEYALSIRQDTE